MEEKANILSKEGVLLVILSIIAIVSCYFYELGQCRYYHIPAEFIQIELTKQGLTIFVFISFLYYVVLIDGAINYLYSLKLRWIRISLAVGLILGLLIWQLSKTPEIITYNEFNYTGTALFFSVILMVYTTFRPQENASMLTAKGDFFKLIISNYLSDKVVELLFVLSLSCAILFVLGYRQAKAKKDYMGKVGTGLILVKKYEGLAFYSKLNPDSTFSDKIVVEGFSNQDTFSSIHLGRNKK